MKWFRLTLVLLALPVVVSLLAWWIGDDPGEVLIRRGDVVAEMSLVTAIVLALMALMVGWLVIAIVRWPLRFWLRGARRRGRQRFFDGLLCLLSGRPIRAEQQMLKAGQMPSLRLSAWMVAHAAAHARGDRQREGEILAELGRAPATARLSIELRARNELQDGRAGTAIELLTPLDQQGQLSPHGARVFAEALAQRGRTRETLALLPRIEQSRQMPDAEWRRLESRLLARAVAETTDAINLHSLWSDLNRDQKRLPDVVLAYARRAVQLNLIPQAATELEATLGHGWSPSVVIAYGLLPTDPKAPPRLRTAEAWLERQSQDAALLLTLGRLARQERHWIKNEDYLRRALAHDAGGQLAAQVWEELGRSYAEQGDAERAARALANALGMQHGEKPQKLIGKHHAEDLLAPLPVAEERDAMGIPRLPSRA
jgi:HemY protein